jgi:hypothetical protein
MTLLLLLLACTKEQEQPGLDSGEMPSFVASSSTTLSCGCSAKRLTMSEEEGVTGLFYGMNLRSLSTTGACGGALTTTDFYVNQSSHISISDFRSPSMYHQQGRINGALFIDGTVLGYTSSIGSYAWRGSFTLTPAAPWVRQR